MKLTDLVSIDNRFEKSINLLLDLNHEKKVSDYIPTRSSIRLLKEYLSETITYTGSRATALIGPYGKGKSHLLLVLLYLLSMGKTPISKSLIKRITAIDPECKELLKNVVNSGTPFLPVVLNVNPNSTLEQSLIRSLFSALDRDKLYDATPDSYFSKALEIIDQWKEEYPRTYDALCEMLKENHEDIQSLTTGLTLYDADFVFSTNVTMANSLELFDKYTWDYIIIDECHRATAETYQKILHYFEPQFLLGITATPERMDGGDVFSLFDQNVPYELRLRDAIMHGLVVPFKYYGIRDELIEYGFAETRGHHFIEQFSDEAHCEFIYQSIEKHRLPGQKLKALAFCRDISHAIRMSQAMEEYYPGGTQFLTGKNSTGERIRAYNDLQSDSSDLQILFTVDILNEGVDIPGVNMVLFLRPTDSQTIFIQQLGRGLRNYEGKKYVTVLDFIGNDYKRSVQIAFALGSLSENFVMEKKLVAALIQDDYKSIGLAEYGVEIHIDELSKKEILSFIDEVNFNTKKYLAQDYKNFKNYISAESYPQHVDYLNNDYAPDLIKFMQSKIGAKKNASYYGFLKAIGEENIPSFDERQETFVRYVSEMLPLVRPYEYLMIQSLVQHAGSATLEDIIANVKLSVIYYRQEVFDHALHYMLKTDFFQMEGNILSLKDVSLNVELDEYMQDLLEYGLGKYDVDFSDATPEETFHLWAPYRKSQVQQLLLNNPEDIMLGTKIYDGIVYIYVTVIKDSSIKEALKYADGYIDPDTFQWETVANVSENELAKLKASRKAHIFVRKVEGEDGITLPFTYIGEGKMQYIENSKKENGAYLFNIAMDVTAPEDIYFDFRRP